MNSDDEQEEETHPLPGKFGFMRGNRKEQSQREAG